MFSSKGVPYIALFYNTVSQGEFLIDFIIANQVFKRVMLHESCSYNLMAVNKRWPNLLSHM